MTAERPTAAALAEAIDLVKCALEAPSSPTRAALVSHARSALRRAAAWAEDDARRLEATGAATSAALALGRHTAADEVQLALGVVEHLLDQITPTNRSDVMKDDRTGDRSGAAPWYAARDQGRILQIVANCNKRDARPRGSSVRVERFDADLHLPMINKWSRPAGGLSRDVLPKTGFVVDRVAVAFLARADSGGVAYVETILTDPDASPALQSASFARALREVMTEAKRCGCLRLICPVASGFLAGIMRESGLAVFKQMYVGVGEL